LPQKIPPKTCLIWYKLTKENKLTFKKNLWYRAGHGYSILLDYFKSGMGEMTFFPHSAEMDEISGAE